MTSGQDSGSPIHGAARRRLQVAVLKWYDKHGRKLPWRESANPYRIWLSEIMLQQTTVAAVVPYFERFTAKFSDIRALASADVDDVLKLWEGLGYYSRARNLHKAALEIVRDHDGEFPQSVTTLQTLPGIGRYTAGAVASFAFDQPAAIVEANTERLYARLMGLQEDVRSTAVQKRLWQFAEAIVPAKRAGDFNQALMDLGSKVCRPQQPDCMACPLSSCCVAFDRNLQHEVPVRKPRTATTAISELAVILHRSGKFLLRRRTEAERWAGMWDFVRFEIDHSDVVQLPLTSRLSKRRLAANVPAAEAEGADRRTTKGIPRVRSLFTASADHLPESVAVRIREQARCDAAFIHASMDFSYSVTRYKVRLHCFVCEAANVARKLSEGLHWFAIAEMQELPLSGTGREIARWLGRLPMPPT